MAKRILRKSRAKKGSFGPERRIWSKYQITSADQIKVGLIIYIHGHSQKPYSKEMAVITSTPTIDSTMKTPKFELIYLSYLSKNVPAKYRTTRFLSDSSVIGYSKTTWNNVNFLTTRGKIMPSEELEDLLSKTARSRF